MSRLTNVLRLVERESAQEGRAAGVLQVTAGKTGFRV